jgi:hypothetical protein
MTNAIKVLLQMQSGFLQLESTLLYFLWFQYKYFSKIYMCPRVVKKLHNLFVIKDINFFFFLDDSYASTAYSENIAVYIQGVPIL